MDIQTAFDKIEVNVVAVTQPLLDPSIPNAEALMAYCARVSNPSNQHNSETADKLLAYCIKHGHWSVFEMANVVLEIVAPRDISRQILRHKSSAFQEFSQRYADVTPDMFCLRDLRMQDDTNRQNSVSVNNSDWEDEWETDQREVLKQVNQLVEQWRSRGAAKEVTRVLYPEGLTMSRMYFNGNVRNLLHYCRVRSGNGTQTEHVDVAIKVEQALRPLIPNTMKAYMETLA